MEINKASDFLDIPLTEEETQAFDKYMPIKTFEKGKVLLKAGQIAQDCYFMIKGCIRHYYLVDGEEKTTFFYTEYQAVASMTSYQNQVPANHYFECVEDSTVVVLNRENEEKLIKVFPKYETLCRGSMQSNFGQNQDMLANYITKSPKERYLHLLETRPELLDRIPQYHLASYIGVTPESLSRIRKRILAEK